MTIPATTKKITRPEVACLGVATGLGAKATGVAGVVETATRGAAELAVDLFTLRLAGAFLATLFLAADFFTTRFAVLFLATLFFTTLFFAELFFTELFFAELFFAAAFFTTRFAGAFLATLLAELFFFTATMTPWIAVRTRWTHVYGSRLPQPPKHFHDMRCDCTKCLSAMAH